MSTTRALRRHHRERVIARRVFIRRQVQGFRDEWMPAHVGRFAKWNLTCSCHLCRANEAWNAQMTRRQLRAADRALRDQGWDE